MLKLLCVCDQGINRSVHIASLLKFTHDTIAVGLDTNSQETLKMLYDWADYIILTEPMQQYKLPAGYQEKIKILNVGQDTYSRPYNKVLYNKLKSLFQENKWLDDKNG